MSDFVLCWCSQLRLYYHYYHDISPVSAMFPNVFGSLPSIIKKDPSNLLQTYFESYLSCKRDSGFRNDLLFPPLTKSPLPFSVFSPRLFCSGFFTTQHRKLVHDPRHTFSFLGWTKKVSNVYLSFLYSDPTV